MTKNCLLYILFVSLLNTACSKQAKSIDYFKFNLLREPVSLNPAHMSGASGNYLLNNIYRGFYFKNKSLFNENVHNCEWITSLKLICHFKKKKLSNGQPVTAQSYLKNFKNILSGKSLLKSELVNIKGVSSYLRNKISIDEIGIKILGEMKLAFEFETPDSDFLNILASAAYSPIPPDQDFSSSENIHQLITNGPYKVKEWLKGKHIILEPNPYYDNDYKKRPLVKIYFLENDETAINLYQSKQLNFLRRLPTHYFSKYKDSNQLMFVPMLRFDYIGLTGEFAKLPKLRKALALSLNFPELKMIYSAKGMPGCPGLPKPFFSTSHCLQFNPKLAQKIFSELPADIKNRTWTLYYSRLGGKDIKKGMEWVHHQWKKNLNLKIKLQAVEQGMYLNSLRTQQFNMFRKGVGVNQNSCLSALRTFSSTSNENYIGFSNKLYDKTIARLSLPKNINSKKLCSQGLKLLIESHQWIPLGEIHFAMLSDKKYRGWTVNNLNQLDLTHLRKN